MSTEARTSGPIPNQVADGLKRASADENEPNHKKQCTAEEKQFAAEERQSAPALIRTLEAGAPDCDLSLARAAGAGSDFSIQLLLERSVLSSINGVFTRFNVNERHMVAEVKERLQVAHRLLAGLRRLSFAKLKRKLVERVKSERPAKLSVDAVVSRLVARSNELLPFTETDKTLTRHFQSLRVKLDALFGVCLSNYRIKDAVSSGQRQLRALLETSRCRTEAKYRCVADRIDEMQSLLEPFRKRLVVACFSGFSKSCGPKKEDLGDIIVALGGVVAPQGEFNDTITHVISTPQFPKTMRSLGGSLLSKWVVSYEWLTECQRAGKWVDETAYGFKNAENPFEGKRVFLSESFFEENLRYYSQEVFLTLFKRIAKMSLVGGPDEADIVMVGSPTSNNLDRLSWSQFSDFVLGNK